MNNIKSKFSKLFGTVAGIALSITVLALNPLPFTPSLFLFGEPEYPSED